LKHLSTKFEIYDRKQVEESCFLAIDQLNNLNTVLDLKKTKDYNLYPTAESLQKLELLYGETITRTDINGTQKTIFHHNFNEKQKSTEKLLDLLNLSIDSPSVRLRTRVSSPSPQSSVDGSSVDLFTSKNNKNTKNNVKNMNSMNLKMMHSNSGSILLNIASTTSLLNNQNNEKNEKRKEFIYTDCRNENFEKILNERPFMNKIDFIEEHSKIRKQVWEDMLRRKENDEKKYEQTINKVLMSTGILNNANNNNNIGNQKEQKIYLYSQQTLNFKNLSLNELKNRIKEDKNTTYSFSKNFISQTITVIDEEEELKKKSFNYKNPDKSAWLTKKGFQYPKPKTRQDLIQHDKKPTETRIDDLHDPFYDQNDILQIEKQTKMLQNYHTKDLENNFVTRIKPVEIFGTLQPIEYNHDFQLNLVGNRTKLPRGIAINNNEKDENFFKSIHIGGVEKQKILNQAKIEEKKNWESKVIVDTIDFKISGLVVHDKTFQFNRTNDILKDEPKRESLIHMRNKITEKGKNLSYTTAPLSVFSKNEPYIQNETKNILLRTTNPNKFITSQNFSSNDQLALTNFNTNTNTQNNTFNNINNEYNNNNSYNSSNNNNNANITKVNNTNKNTNEKPVDFKLYINKYACDETKLNGAIARKKHPRMDKTSVECTGARWEGA